MLKDKIQNPSKFLFRFSLGGNVMDQRTSRSIDGYTHIPSALNKIILNSYFKKKVSLEEQKAQKEDWFLRGRQIAYMIYNYFWATGAHDTVLDYADLFTITHRNNDVQEFDTRWDEILLSMTKIPPDDVQEILYKLRILGSHQLKT